MKRYSLWLCAALIVVVGVTPSVHAQFGQRLGGLFYDPDAYARRYSYQLSNFSGYTFNSLTLTPEQLRYLDYLDRADRAEKFGYRMPIDPYFETEQPAPLEPTVRAGFGRWRRR